ncbi:hypothetical protein C5D09_06355 [Rathayibacter sp. AY1C9]|uniref:phage portal protein n=1 Tax=Rathayibacter sp. AY1C9 TaxID=2080541 RepID=UPI000CE7FA1A|nr:phage portal protein [Rathayibacter sp. AY1C9]PPH46997.1 hypothetical protein C5D09_06355 [Rathayibacter sp. AY1C9]
MPTPDFITRTSARLSAAGVGTAQQIASPWSNGDHLTQITLDDLYGITGGMKVTRGKAMKLPVISKGRRIMAGTIGRMGLRTMKAGRPAPAPLALLAQPERERSASATLTWTVDALMFYPRTWWIVQERDSYGWPAWVKLLPHADAEFDRDGKLAKAWGKPVAAADVIEFESPDSGLLIDADETIRRAYAINRAAALAEANPVPSIELHNDGEDLDNEEIDQLLQTWVDARAGKGVGYTSKSLKATPMGQHPEQLLIAGRDRLDLDLARHLGMPAWLADVAVQGSTLTYSNRASRNWEVIDLFLAPHMTAITSRLSMADVTPRGWEVRFNTDDLTRDDQKTRFEAYKLGKDAGFLTNQWIAEQEGWDTPAPEKDPAA